MAKSSATRHVGRAALSLRSSLGLPNTCPACCRRLGLLGRYHSTAPPIAISFNTKYGTDTAKTALDESPTKKRKAGVEKLYGFKVLSASPPLSVYKELAKPRLSALIVLTSMSAYAIAPYHSDSLITLLGLTAGTSLSVASANAFNQFSEPVFDAQMARTRNRPLVRGAIMPHQAFTFASLCGLSGVSTLWFGVNPTTAILGLSNIILYAGIYTPLKRLSIVNTWVGSVVGALPPMMGWTACSNGDLFSHPGGLILGGILFAWQFPHFNSLSWNIRSEYARAGYRMMCVTNPGMTARVSLRWTLACWPLAFALPYTGLVDWTFVADSSVANAYLTLRAWEFYRSTNDKTARNLFFASLIHLPALLILAMVHHTSLYWIDGDVEGKADRDKVEEIE